MSSVIFTKLDFEVLLKNPKKGVRRQLQICKHAIELMSEKGLEGLTYEELSQRANLPRPLIYYYYPTPTDLLIFCVSLIRYKYQNYVIDGMKSKATARDLLEAYFTYAVKWVDDYPQDASVWLIFFHRCAVSEALAVQNRELVDIGTKRIAGIIDIGRRTQQFGLAENRIAETARRIQILITGLLLSKITEGRQKNDVIEEAESIWSLCLEMVQPLQ